MCQKCEKKSELIKTAIEVMNDEKGMVAVFKPSKTSGGNEIGGEVLAQGTSSKKECYFVGATILSHSIDSVEDLMIATDVLASVISIRLGEIKAEPPKTKDSYSLQEVLDMVKHGNFPKP